MDARVADNNSFSAKVRENEGSSPSLRVGWGREYNVWSWLIGSLEFELPGARRNDRALGLLFCANPLSAYQRGAPLETGEASQSGSEVHQRQILPAFENQEEAGSYREAPSLSKSTLLSLTVSDRGLSMAQQG